LSETINQEIHLDYQKIYNKLIKLGQDNYWNNEKYFEKHHIIPRSEGGSNKKDNLVELPPRAHHLAHLCLIKLGCCLKYCYYNFTIKEYYEAKMLEKKKKHLLIPDEVDTVDEINEYRYEGEKE
jgi:hypothetical protein